MGPFAHRRAAAAAAYKKIHYVRRPIITCEMPSWLLYFFFNIINGVYFNIIIRVHRVQRTGAEKIN
jgi:hypothetical protein